jgi:hypothetical protein
MKLNKLMACITVAMAAHAHAGLESNSALAPAWNQNVEDSTALSADAASPPLWRTKSAVATAATSATSSAVASLSRLNAVTYPNLWSFITSIRAQQQGRSFALLETNATILRLVDSPVAGTVPLPAAGWLLATGLLGLAAGRFRKRRDKTISCVSLHASPAQ